MQQLFYLYVEGLHNFEDIPPQLVLQSETFIHFMNAGNIIVSLSYQAFVHWSMDRYQFGKVENCRRKNLEYILWRKQCAVNCVNTLGALWLPSIYGTSRPRRETREDHHEDIFIFWGSNFFLTELWPIFFLYIFISYGNRSQTRALKNTTFRRVTTTNT